MFNRQIFPREKDTALSPKSQPAISTHFLNEKFSPAFIPFSVIEIDKSFY